MRRGRVLLADDHALVIEGFRRILESEFDVIGAVEDGKTLVSEALRLTPDVILIDISLPILNGLEAARRIRKDLPEAKIVFLTMHADRTYLRDAFRLGASGYLLKNSAGKELLKAVREVLSGRTYLAPELANTIPDPQLRKAFEQGLVPGLTDRQVEVLRLIGGGQTNDEIAASLGITVRTVRFHRSEIARKLGISGTPALTQYAVAHGIVRRFSSHIAPPDIPNRRRHITNSPL
jgi:DNA-binding NarL/FixJ family response regulator